MGNIIICGGADSPALSFIEKINEGTYILIGADRGALVLAEAGYRLDYAVGDFDSVDERELEFIKNSSDNFELNPDQNFTDMELALDIASEKLTDGGQIYILGGLGMSKGRLDHMLANLWLVHKNEYAGLAEKITFIEYNQMIKFYQPGQHKLSQIKPTQYLSIITMTPVIDLEIKGAKYELEKVSYNSPRALVSNEFISDLGINLSFTSGLVMATWYFKEDL